MQSPSYTLTPHKKAAAPSKLILGFLVAATTAIIGVSGVAGANGLPDHASDAAHANANAAATMQGGAGYGGDVDIDINVEGDNNNFTIIIRYFIGS